MKEAIMAILASHTEFSSDIVTISNQTICGGTFEVVSIGHMKTHGFFSVAKGGKNSSYFNAIFETRMLQSLVSCEYFFLCLWCIWWKVSNRVDYIQDNKVVTVSSMQK